MLLISRFESLVFHQDDPKRSIPKDRAETSPQSLRFFLVLGNPMSPLSRQQEEEQQQLQQQQQQQQQQQHQQQHQQHQQKQQQQQ